MPAMPPGGEVRSSARLTREEDECRIAVSNVKFRFDPAEIRPLRRPSAGLPGRHGPGRASSPNGL